jgi:hypothetical protein
MHQYLDVDVLYASKRLCIRFINNLDRFMKNEIQLKNKKTSVSIKTKIILHINTPFIVNAIQS